MLGRHLLLQGSAWPFAGRIFGGLWAIFGLALCASWQVTCWYAQIPGKMQAPLFHDMQILSALHVVPAVEGMGLHVGGEFKHRSAHWVHM